MSGSRVGCVDMGILVLVARGPAVLPAPPTLSLYHLGPRMASPIARHRSTPHMAAHVQSYLPQPILQTSERSRLRSRSHPPHHAGAYDAVYVRRLLHRPSDAEIASVRAFAKSAARHTAKALPFATEGSALVAGEERHEDSQHSDEEVAILMESPSRRRSPLTRFQDCTSPVERFTTSRLIAEMLKHAGQVCLLP